jgi:NADPH:quinone reductase
MSVSTGEAVVMREYGAPAVLRIEHMTLPALQPGEIRVRSVASAVNHSDLEIRAGAWPILKPEPFPYVPGLEVVGDVVEVGEAVSEVQVGDRVISMMQGLGGVRAKRPGGYAEYVTLSAAAAAPVLSDLDPYGVAALGLGAVTAFEGLRKLGPMGGKRIAITGAAGGVGSAGVGIAKALGAEVIAVVSQPAQAEYVRSLGATTVVVGRDVARGTLGEELLDGILDTVGGDLFGGCVAALRPGATLSLVGAVAGSQVSFDAYRLIEVTLTGYGSENLTGLGLHQAIGQICQWLKNGELVPPARSLYPLKDAVSAHERLENHKVQGRLLLVPSA